MRHPFAVAVLALLSSGCADFASDPTVDEQATTTSARPPDPEHCQPYGTGSQDCTDILLRVSVTSTEAVALGIPYPHGPWCLSQDDWDSAAQSGGPIAALQQSERGPVFWLDGVGPFEWQARVVTTHRAFCETLRHDPWSTEPERAENDGVEVYVEAGAVAEVLVTVRAGGCTTRSPYDATSAAQAGWTLLNYRKTPTLCA